MDAPYVVESQAKMLMMQLVYSFRAHNYQIFCQNHLQFLIWNEEGYQLKIPVSEVILIRKYYNNI